MRWRAFDVDYEMSGKDLIDSVKLSSQICRVIGGNPPENLTYELFLDQEGQKISKSKGNGLTIDEWLTYAPAESLAYYMFQAPRKAKRLYFDVIPRAVDDYLNLIEKYPHQQAAEQIDNAVYHIHQGKPPLNSASSLSFGILLNLASVCNAESSEVLWGFVQRYLPNASPETMPVLGHLIDHAIHYYQDFVKPQKVYRQPTSQEAAALKDLYSELGKLNNKATAEDLQFIIFEVGKRHNFTELRAWFGTLYEVLLGQKEGPRMGSFIAVYGVDNTCKLIQEKLGAFKNP
jgi:lysyl-tRNA synthetase class 1